MNEADTCKSAGFLTKLQEAGWDDAPCSIAEQRIFTNPKGRIRVIGGKIVRSKPKRTDYLLRYRLDFPSRSWKRKLITKRQLLPSPVIGVFGEKKTVIRIFSLSDCRTRFVLSDSAYF